MNKDTWEAYAGLAFLVAVFVWVVILPKACQPDTASKSQATTRVHLWDMSSNVDDNAESFWFDPSNRQMYRCHHGTETGNRLTDASNNCDEVDMPDEVDNQAVMLAINWGDGIKTQSIWLSEGVQRICDHGASGLFSHKIDTSIQSCRDFDQPDFVQEDSMLVSFNTGDGIKAQSFWLNENGTYTVCDHDKDHGLFTATKLAEATGCSSMSTPTDLFPGQVRHPILVAVTADGSLPAESFWQDESSGTVIRCKHHKDGAPGRDDRVGRAEFCGYFEVPDFDN